jgi:hypothetical protein
MAHEMPMDADELAQSLDHIADNLPILSILGHGYQHIGYVHVAGPPPTPLPDVPEHCRIIYHAAACPRLASANCACTCAPMIQASWGIVNITPREPVKRERHTLSHAQRSENARRSWTKRRARAQA